MAAAKAKTGGLDALLERAEPEPAFVAPSPVGPAEDPQFHTVAERMTIAPEPVVEPEPEPVAEAAPEPVTVIAEPPEEQTPTPPSERPVKAEVPDGWYDMDGAPDSGKPVFLLGPDDPPHQNDFPYVEALWRNTRFYDKRGGR